MVQLVNCLGEIALAAADPLVETAVCMIEHYNAQDADAYVALMTETACEANTCPRGAWPKPNGSTWPTPSWLPGEPW